MGYADWVELAALLQGWVSKEDTQDILVEETLLEDVRDPDEPDRVQDFVEDVWRQLGARRSRLGESFPVTVERDGVRSDHEEPLEDRPGYCFLLIADVGRFYPGIDAGWEPGSEISKLFEEVVEASLSAAQTTTTVRFGSPFDDTWPAGSEPKFHRLGDELGLSLLRADVIDPHDNDKGADVISRLSFGDDLKGSPILLTQCTVAKQSNWKKKSVQPTYENWRDLFDWDAPLQRYFATPFALKDPEKEYGSWYRELGSVVLDRMRLCARDFSDALGADSRGQLTDWCRERANELSAYRADNS